MKVYCIKEINEMQDIHGYHEPLNVSKWWHRCGLIRRLLTRWLNLRSSRCWYLRTVFFFQCELAHSRSSWVVGWPSRGSRKRVDCSKFPLEAVSLLEKRANWTWYSGFVWGLPKVRSGQCIDCSSVYRSIGFLQITIRRPSTPELKQKSETVFRSGSAHGLSPHMIPTSINRWHLFCQFIFCWALLAFLSLSDC